MNTTIILIVLAVIVLLAAVAFIILTVQRSGAGYKGLNTAMDYARANEFTSSDIRSKKIKCRRCGDDAFGVLGTGNIYRCRTCGDKTEGPLVEPGTVLKMPEQDFTEPPLSRLAQSRNA